MAAVNIVTTTDFVGPEVGIPNIELRAGSFGIIRDKYEKHILSKHVLGMKLYTEFIQGLQVLPTPEQKWLDLLNGRVYVVDGVDRLYGGMKEFMIPYIYSEYLTTTYDNHAAIGITIAYAENSQTISPATRICNRWNEAVDIIGGCNQINCIYDFLNANKDVYTGWVFKPMEKINIWNI